MKVTLFLLSCLVGVSLQEAYAPYGFDSSPFYNPYYQYAYPGGYPYQQPYQQPNQQPLAQGRTPSNFGNPEKRFFFSGIQNLNLRLAVTSTLTDYVYSTFTATSAIVSNCIVTDAFADAKSGGVICRKRREIAAFHDLFADEIAATQVKTIEETAVPVLSERKQEVEPQISSSQYEHDPTDVFFPENRSIRLTSYVTVTSTFSTYSFTTVTLKNKFGSNFVEKEKATCRPSGWGLCA